MAERIVDLLEALDVDKQQGHQVSLALGVEAGLLKTISQQHAVGNAGQTVIVRVIVEFDLLALGNDIEQVVAIGEAEVAALTADQEPTCPMPASRMIWATFSTVQFSSTTMGWLPPYPL